MIEVKVKKFTIDNMLHLDNKVKLFYSTVISVLLHYKCNISHMI